MRLVLILLIFLTSLRVMGDTFVRFEEKGKVGLKDERGKVLIPPTFEALGWSDGNFSVIGQVTGYKLKDRWGIINLQKELITPAEFESMTYPGGERIIVSRKINPFTVKFGCLDLAGKVMVPFQYDGISISGLRAIVFIKNGTSFEYGLIDLLDKSYIPRRFRHIESIGTLRYAVENEKRKTALFSEQGVQLTDFVIDSLSAFHHGLAIIYQDLSQGLIDREGMIQLKASYRELRITDEGTVTGRDFDEWKIIDAANREYQKIKADQLERLTDDLYQIRLADKTGLLDSQLRIILPVAYDYLGPEDHGNRVAGRGTHYGIIRPDTSLLLPFEFDSLMLSDNFIRAVRISLGRSGWSLYDTFGIQKTSSPFDFIGPYNGKFFPAKKRGYWGAINRYGEEFINCVFDSLMDARNEWVAVRYRGQFGIVDSNERWIVAPQQYPLSPIDESHYFETRDTTTFVKGLDGKVIYFTTNPILAEGDSLKEILPNGSPKFLNYDGVEIGRREMPVKAPGLETVFRSSEGMRAIKKDGKYGFVDERGRLRIANRYDDVGEFHEGLAPIKLIGKWGFVNMQDQIVIHPNYEVVGDFNNRMAIVWRGGKAGTIDPTGKAGLPFRYDSIGRLPDRTFKIKAGAYYGLADEKGNVIIEPRFDFLSNLGDGSVITGRDGKYGLQTRHGYSLVPMIYDQLVPDMKNKQFLALTRAPWKELKLH